jgi:hypothetical protein
MGRIREAETYGRYRLSVQASSTHYCEPREDGLNLSDYAEVELALFDGDEWTRPSEIPGLEDLDELWEQGMGACVGGWIPRETVERIRSHLQKLAGEVKRIPISEEG